MARDDGSSERPRRGLHVAGEGAGSDSAAGLGTAGGGGAQQASGSGAGHAHAAGSIVWPQLQPESSLGFGGGDASEGDDMGDDLDEAGPAPHGGTDAEMLKRTTKKKSKGVGTRSRGPGRREAGLCVPGHVNLLHGKGYIGRGVCMGQGLHAAALQVPPCTNTAAGPTTAFKAYICPAVRHAASSVRVLPLGAASTAVRMEPQGPAAGGW